MVGGSDGTSCSSLSISLEGEMETVSMADVPESLRCSGVEGAAGDAALGEEAGGAPA